MPRKPKDKRRRPALSLTVRPGSFPSSTGCSQHAFTPSPALSNLATSLPSRSARIEPWTLAAQDTRRVPTPHPIQLCRGTKSRHVVNTTEPGHRNARRHTPHFTGRTTSETKASTGVAEQPRRAPRFRRLGNSEMIAAPRHQEKVSSASALADETTDDASPRTRTQKVPNRTQASAQFRDGPHTYRDSPQHPGQRSSQTRHGISPYSGYPSQGPPTPTRHCATAQDTDPTRHRSRRTSGARRRSTGCR